MTEVLQGFNCSRQIRSEKMWTPPKLPYHVASDQLRAQVPSTQEIRMSKTVLSQRSAQVVKVIGEEFVVKYGRGTNIQEGFNLIFLHEHVPSLPIPRLWAMYEEDEDIFIVMEFIKRDTLQDIWSSLQIFDKSAITKHLRSIMDALRVITPPDPPFYGSLDHGSLPYFLFYTMESIPAINGPFTMTSSKA